MRGAWAMLGVVVAVGPVRADVLVPEGADFPGVSSFNPDRAVSIGTLALGNTIVRGRLAGNAVGGDANPANGGDTQDSFLFVLAPGTQLASVGVVTRAWTFSGIQLLSASVVVREPTGQLVQSGTGNLAWNQTLPLAVPADAGTYGASIFGQSSFFATGSYTLDYDVVFTVVPGPGTAALAGVAGAGVLGRRRRNSGAGTPIIPRPADTPGGW